MSKDFLWKRQQDMVSIPEWQQLLSLNDLLIDIEHKLKHIGKLDANFDMDIPNYQLNQSAINTESEVDPNAQYFYEENIDSLNSEKI